MRQPGLAELLRNHQTGFCPILAFDPRKQKLTAFDFTSNNKQLTSDVLNDTKRFCGYIDEQLAKHKAIYGIGGYAEHRTIYSRSNLFDSQLPGEEPRRLHLGTDIWGKAGTAISAALDGTIHSVAFNDQPGDYGATIILRHCLDDNIFHSLYGHLSLGSIKNSREGELIRKGQTFAWLGIPEENGQWPPHLHLQLIKNIKDHKGDYPGVCRYSEKEYYLENCPDPDLVLQMNRYIANQL